MRLLLDTHALIWLLEDNPKLSTRAKANIIDPANERWISPICLLEIAIKVKIGNLRLTDAFAAIFPSQLATPRTRSHGAVDDTASSPQGPIRPLDRRHRLGGGTYLGFVGSNVR